MDSIDDILQQVAGAQPEPDSVLLEGISSAIGSNLQPAGSLPPSWMLALGLFLICGTVALAGGLFFGLYGVRKMTAAEVGLIFPVLGILIWFAAALCVAEAIPGSRRPVTPWLLGVSGCVGLATVFGWLFHDYGTARFVSQGVKCLTAGLGLALPAAVAMWLVLRRGFSVNPGVAGFAKGTLAGLAGVTMLELHCVNFEVPHLLVWHIAVLPISGAIGMWVATIVKSRGQR